jgi:2-phosphosulfolactate phosphatase
MKRSSHQVHCEWGEHGLSTVLDGSDVVIIVDVLSFTTCVELATSRGAFIHPAYRRDRAAVRLAAKVGAELAGPRGKSGYSLSPSSYREVPAGTRVVLPSPNGSTLSLGAGETPTLAGCLRNASAVAAAARSLGPRIAVVPAGERWSDGSLRPCLEDWLGAGAILAELAGSLSPEARAAASTFTGCKADITTLVRDCFSGRELAEWGYGRDVELACQLNVSRCVPRLIDGAFVDVHA